jgi:NAD(P)-dependent dehydrogenase (short-subunit alcohol dehydrogenase family)
VTDPASIARAAQDIEEQHGRLDILVNNAGITGSFRGAPSEVTPGQLRQVYDTNVFGVAAVTNQLLPLLRRSAAGRIVNMSSGLGSLTLSSDPGSEFAHYNLVTYQSSKTALNALTVAYAKELRETAIKVNAADPGFTATDLNNHRGYRTVEQAAVIAVRLATLGADGPTGTFQDENGAVPW